MEEPLPPDPEAVHVPITGEIDLHTYRPSEIGSLLPEYFRECRLRGILSVRVVHGKGTGTLRSGVLTILRTDPAVHSFRTGSEVEGSWGATVVQLLPWDEAASDGQ